MIAVTIYRRNPGKGKPACTAGLETEEILLEPASDRVIKDLVVELRN